MSARRAVAVAAVIAGGCAEPPAPPAAGGDGAAPAIFTDVAAASGLDFVHHAGATERLLLPEIMGGGAGWLDADGDGWLDAYLVQAAFAGNRLYRNDGRGGFVDVTIAAGVGDTGFGNGCAAADVDNDGDVDLYVTNLGPNVLYRNRGDGTFEDVTATAGVGDPGWSTSAAFLDYDRDGALDLFVTNYVRWEETPTFVERRCYAPTGEPDYCSPQAYDAPTRDTLYRNRGDGTFEDVSAASGVHDRAGTGLGVVCTDLDGDGLVDIYVANDQMPSFAWINSPAGHFTERAVSMGIAVDEMGRPQAGMGVDAGDVDRDGDQDLWKVHLRREAHVLYENRTGYFDDATARFGLAAATRMFTGFGTAFLDVDLDGRLDLFVANGRVQRTGDESDGRDPYAEPNQLLRQTAAGRFEDVSASAGLDSIASSRGAAFGDYDNDGDLDVLVVNRDGPAALLRNDAARRGSFVTLRVLDEHGRDALGAVVTAAAGETVWVREVRASYSYCATNDPRVHIGLGGAAGLDRVTVRWPDGATESFGPQAAGAFATLRRSAPIPDAPEVRGAAPTPRAEFMEIARRLQEGGNEFLGRAAVDELTAALAAAGAAPARALPLQVRLVVERLRVGEVDAAIEGAEQALALARRDPDLARALPGIHRVRGLAYLRQAEVANCISRHNAECCIFPLAGGGVHAIDGPARRAMESYLACAEVRPDDLKLRWLLNLVAMALGEYPNGVPARHRIPPEVFDSEQDIGRFVDVAPRLGIDPFNLCGGAITEDFDGDGRLDIVTSTFDPEGPLRLYRNTGAGGFDDRTRASRLDEQLGGLNCVAADYDDDGDVDVLVLRGAWLFDDGQIRNSLLRNMGDGTFTDVTHAAGLAAPARPTQAAAWGDFDGDGDLDLYVANESRAETDRTGRGRYPSQLFRNDGDGTFTDVAAAAGVTNDRYAKGVTAGDFDNDGDLDLYVSNVGRNRLYRNDGAGGFTDVAEAMGVTGPEGRSFACWFFDFDNDGWLDLFVAGYDAKVEAVAADYLGRPETATRPRLYRNNGDGTFADVAAAVGLDHAWLPMGANFGDVDNDGWLDVYLATGDPDFQTLMPNVLLRNDAGRRFLDVTTSAGVGHLQKGHGVAFADLDHDGDQDLYHQLGGFFPGDGFANALFENPGHGNRFLVVHLRGTTTNRFGLGARITVTVEGAGGPRRIHRAVGSVSSFGGSPFRQEIGLGDARAITEFEVWWPVSGVRQRVVGVPLDGAIRITEGAEGFEVVPYEAVTWRAN